MSVECSTDMTKKETLNQLEKKALSELHKKYKEDRLGVIERFGIMKHVGNYKVFVFHHRHEIYLNFGWENYPSIKTHDNPDKKLIEKLIELYPPVDLFYHKSTFTGIYRKDSNHIKEDGTTEQVYPFYIETEPSNACLKFRWKTKTHAICVELLPHMTRLKDIKPVDKITYQGGHTLSYWPHQESFDIMEYIL